jgi:hypothetical protein
MNVETTAIDLVFISPPQFAPSTVHHGDGHLKNLAVAVGTNTARLYCAPIESARIECAAWT